MSKQTIFATSKQHKFSRSSKKSFSWLLIRAVLALLLIWGFIYLANQAMLFGLDKFLP